MAYSLTTKNIQIGATICAVFAAAAVIQTTAQRVSHYFTQRDNHSLAEVVGWHNINDNRVSDAFALQLTEAVLPRITDAHFKINSSASSVFFVKQPAGNPDVAVAMTSAHPNIDGTYFTIPQGSELVTYECRSHTQLYVDVNSLFPRHKAYLADISGHCKDIQSARHIDMSRGKTNTANRISHTLRDDIVLRLTQGQLLAESQPSVEVNGTQYVIRRNPPDYFLNKRNPYVFLHGAAYECDLAMSAVSAGPYRDQTDRHPHPVLTVYSCRKAQNG